MLIDTVEHDKENWREFLICGDLIKMLSNRKAETYRYLQAFQWDAMDESGCVIVELVSGGLALLHQRTVTLLDAIPHLRCRLLDSDPWHNHSLSNKISLSDMHLLENLP
jgi:hypothetical protein